jgi:GNAT superfamily N-acetyltransferase
MALVVRRPVGLEYLGTVTSLLQHARNSDPTGGIWEAADLQWWWRRDQHPDSSRQVFWFDGEDPVAAAVLQDWGASFACEVLSSGHDLSPLVDTVWPVVTEMIQPFLAAGVDISVREDDPVLTDLAVRAGSELGGEVTVETWMPTSQKAGVSSIPQGFELVSRLDVPQRPHHMIGRNGERVATLLAECSLYRPDLDLAVYAPDGRVAGYGLFWADPVTGVGLVEPMRTEDEFQNMGIARHVLTSGLDRLARLGCSRMKVSYVEGNNPARRLYLSAGFEPGPRTVIYRLPQAQRS